MKNGKYVQPTKWEECEREDLNMIPKMVANGFVPEFSYKDRMHKRTTVEMIPTDAVSFVKGNLHVWKIYEYKDGMNYEWMTSELIDGYYTNHKPIDKLEEILK